MSKVIWRANRVISIETRRKDENRKENVYVLAQMINNAQLLVFNLFSTDNRWENIDLNEVYAGLQIQLLTYLDAACKEEDLLPAGILYFNLIEQMVKAEKNIGIEKIEEQIRKGFKMKGLILADVKVVKLHDKNLDSGYSNLVPAYISKKTGDISEGNSSCVSKEEFKDLQDYMYKVIKQISNEILSGKIDLKPFYKNKKTPCSYCDYRSICNFNNGACQNKYNFIDEKSKKEILEKIKQEKSN